MPYRASHRFENKPSHLAKYWASLGFIIKRISNLNSHRTHKKYYFDLFDNPVTWNNFHDGIDAAVNSAKRHEIPMVAVLFPLFSDTIDNHYPFFRLHTKVMTLLQSYSIPALDLLESYQNIPVERLQVMPGKDAHPNEIAHRIASEAIYQWLVSSHAIPERLEAPLLVTVRDGFPHLAKFPQRKKVRG